MGHINYDKKLFSGLQEKEGGMCMELGDDATYSMKLLGSISFSIALGDILKLTGVLFIIGLKKNLLSIYFLEDHSCRVPFKGQP